MELSLVIFSGLPGTGKSALSSRVSRDLGLPLLRIDDLVARMPAAWQTFDVTFWDSAVSMLLYLAEAQLALGVSVVVDSVFMAYDRQHAQGIALRHQALFRPVYTFVSDEGLWKQRVTGRAEASEPGDHVAGWEQVQHQREHFLPWEPGTALFVDMVQPLEQNYALVKDFITRKEVGLQPLLDSPRNHGSFHV